MPCAGEGQTRLRNLVCALCSWGIHAQKPMNAPNHVDYHALSEKRVILAERVPWRLLFYEVLHQFPHVFHYLGIAQVDLGPKPSGYLVRTIHFLVAEAGFIVEKYRVRAFSPSTGTSVWLRYPCLYRNWRNALYLPTVLRSSTRRISPPYRAMSISSSFASQNSARGSSSNRCTTSISISIRVFPSSTSIERIGLRVSSGSSPAE